MESNLVHSGISHLLAGFHLKNPMRIELGGEQENEPSQSQPADSAPPPERMPSGPHVPAVESDASSDSLAADFGGVLPDAPTSPQKSRRPSLTRASVSSRKRLLANLVKASKPVVAASRLRRASGQ
jgi:hypothetical protein